MKDGPGGSLGMDLGIGRDDGCGDASRFEVRVIDRILADRTKLGPDAPGDGP